MSKKPEILIKATFSNAHGKQMFSSQSPVHKNLANKSDLIIEFTLNSVAVQRQGHEVSYRNDKSLASWLKSWVYNKEPASSLSWSLPLAATLPGSGDKIGSLEVEVTDTDGKTIMGGTSDIFGKVTEGPMVFEEHLILGGEDRHNLEDWEALTTTGSRRLVGQATFTLNQAKPN